MRHTALGLLLFTSCLATALTVYHRFEPDPPLLSLVIPPLMAVCFMALTFRQWRHPERLASTMWMGWILVTLALAAPSWVFVQQALQSGVPLVESLPPVNALFLPTVLVMVVFARPRHAFWGAIGAWALVALPVLGYLAFHPVELWTPRGIDMAISLGPFVLFVLVLIPFIRGLEKRFTVLQQEGERLQQLAERDALIGLYNRRAGERFLDTLLAHADAEASVILFDIDHFKGINDTHGHPAGDTVLKTVGARCTALLRREDVFSRWGGEEFLILLPNAPPDEARATAERLRAAIDGAPIDPVGTVTASFGVTGLRAEDTLGELVQRADDALYRAKAGGRNRVVLA